MGTLPREVPDAEPPTVPPKFSFNFYLPFRREDIYKELISFHKPLGVEANCSFRIINIATKDSKALEASRILQPHGTLANRLSLWNVP